jgi:uncharacterized protein DUF6477
MAGKTHAKGGIRGTKHPEVLNIFDRMADAGARRYCRSRDLPGLLALWPQELADVTTEGSLQILSKLRRALRAERRRAHAGHWSYDLNRHLALLSAYKGEIAVLGTVSAPNRNEPGAGKAARAFEAEDKAAKGSLRLPKRAR